MTTKNVKDLLPGELVVPKLQSTQAHNADTDPEEINSVSIHPDGVTITYYRAEPDTYDWSDEVEVAAPLPTEPLKLRWRASAQKWVLDLVSTDGKALPAVVVEVNGRTAFDGTPKPINGVPTPAPVPVEEP